MEKEQNYKGRGLSDKFLKKLLPGGVLHNLVRLVKENGDEFVLQIRENYINVYYKGGNMLKVTHGPGFSFDKNYFRYNDKLDPKTEHDKMLEPLRDSVGRGEACDFEEFVSAMKGHMDNYWLWLDKSLHEKDVQHKLCINNQEKDEYTIIDLEFQVSTLSAYAYEKPIANIHNVKQDKVSPRFDVVAVRNRDKRLCVIELKEGLGALAGKSGVGDHADSFEGSIGRNPQPFIAEMRKVVENKKALGFLGEGFEFLTNNVEFLYAFAPQAEGEIKAFEEKLVASNCQQYGIIYLPKGVYHLS